ncbi:hypothetical protein ABK898_24620, partial [Klebsiella sp. KE9038]|uniref:hypothetical protein n=1 Tax=Klebsiella sp. KE9038 TaxID=3118149 RepID=UPI003750AF8F
SVPDETTARDVAVVVVPVIREPEKMTVVKRVAGVHSIYRPADGGEPVARARRVKRRPREQSAESLNVPQAMPRICSATNSKPALTYRPVHRGARPENRKTDPDHITQSRLKSTDR